mmetsp:Transcript_6489/g.10320  ORF Transcript_6489/g.10320 Transcript_6489/m.10320 type:complete len:418 (-) Transcript_6489:208-1461(-)|eukprot:CAMPEP_0169309350 /NCGR_PEP_ID=MMETSP1017-20121227/2366_1 /TAXON_ID=342587 /ORGANISM="Karlodinium micrum, Strain CCMP2283" /LENGTH=417 /DNA_ID=CAMNT_0009402873 /DNA_START=67 /DNA_END=1320 /DNA_ORIENTATION=-
MDEVKEDALDRICGTAEKVSACQWRCGICKESFPSADAAKQHARTRHTSSGSQLVSVSAITWDRDAQGLFDREDTGNHHKQGLVMPVQPRCGPLSFLRQGNEIKLATGAGLPEASSPMHTQLNWCSSGAVVERTPTAARQTASKSMWLPVTAKGHVLQTKNLLKLGRYMVSVRQIVLSGPRQVPNFSSVKDVGTAPVAFAQDASDNTCRICLDSGDSEDEGPMIAAPCLCKGGMQYIHLGCLRHWLGSKYSVLDRMSPPVEGAAAYSFKPPACDICKTEFPAVIPQPGTEESVTLLPNLPLVEPPFIVLSLPRSTDKERPHGERCVFKPCESGGLLRIGRSHDSGLQLLDVSVSRLHATVRFDGSNFILQNNEARFGTSVMPRGPSLLPTSVQEEPLSIQAGRTMLRLAMEPMVPIE